MTNLRHLLHDTTTRVSMASAEGSSMETSFTALPSFEEDARRWLSAENGHHSAQLSLSIIQRFAGALSVLGGLHIFWRAWKRRHCVFDRIMLGLSFHTMLWGIYHLWGTAAIPAGTPDIYGAYGTTTTCTVQGFLLQTSIVVPFYYVFLSCYSWVVVMQGNFDPARYEWIEKYIHFGVHVFPIASAIYLLEVESFNSNGLYCWIASIPAGCGDESGIECTRGPQNPHLMMWIFGGMPAIFFLLFPTVVMITLTYCVYLRQSKDVVPCVISASMVAKQSAVYLGSLYWVYLPLFVYNGMMYLKHSSPFWVCLWVNTINTSLGVWFAIVYWYFSTEDEDGDELDTKDANSPHHSDDDAIDKTEPVDGPSVFDGSVDRDSNEEDDEHSETFAELTDPKRRGSGNRTSYANSTVATETVSSRRSSKRFSFNIFDGTASSGMFASFVFDGDSEDEESDEAESRKWEHCQNMNSDR